MIDRLEYVSFFLFVKSQHIVVYPLCLEPKLFLKKERINTILCIIWYQLICVAGDFVLFAGYRLKHLGKELFLILLFSSSSLISKVYHSVLKNLKAGVLCGDEGSLILVY